MPPTATTTLPTAGSQGSLSSDDSRHYSPSLGQSASPAMYSLSQSPASSDGSALCYPVFDFGRLSISSEYSPKQSVSPVFYTTGNPAGFVPAVGSRLQGFMTSTKYGIPTSQQQYGVATSQQQYGIPIPTSQPHFGMPTSQQQQFAVSTSQQCPVHVLPHQYQQLTTQHQMLVPHHHQQLASQPPPTAVYVPQTTSGYVARYEPVPAEAAQTTATPMYLRPNAAVFMPGCPAVSIAPPSMASSEPAVQSVDPSSGQMAFVYAYQPPVAAPPQTKSTLQNPMLNTADIQQVWHANFEHLFSRFGPNRWFLVPATEKPHENYKMFQDSAKVRFLCQSCGNAWTSMKGRVIFWYHLQPENGCGFVYFTLFGQKCQKCMPENFEHAMWYPEEVIKVVANIFSKIGQEYYGFQRPPMIVDRRKGKPRTQHNAQLCQACAVGICREQQLANVMPQPMPS